MIKTQHRTGSRRPQVRQVPGEHRGLPGTPQRVSTNFSWRVASGVHSLKK
jgi:hypothetical protein